MLSLLLYIKPAAHTPAGDDDCFVTNYADILSSSWNNSINVCRFKKRKMVCSFCKGDKNGGSASHNVRTCLYLKASIAVFLAKKGAKLTKDSFIEELIGFGLDICLTGGIASVVIGCYEAYNIASTLIDAGRLMAMSKKEQAAFLLKQGFKLSNEVIESSIGMLMSE